MKIFFLFLLLIVQSATARNQFSLQANVVAQRTDLYRLGTLTETRHYFGGGAERHENIATGTDRDLFYIPGPDGVAAIIKRENGAEQLYFPYADHLGSITALTDISGNVVCRQAFDPWGRRRNPGSLTIDDNALPANYAWLHGFTGHEHLPQFKLINMNARLYDPLLGRMLSPDNYVSDLSNAMTYNLYSYANNNPLIYTDPTGEFFIVDDLILGAVGGIINLASNLGSVHSFAQGAGFFGIGFVSGLVSEYVTPVGAAAIMGAGNAALGGYIKNGSVNVGDVLAAGITSAAMSVVTMGLGSAVSPLTDRLFSGIASPVLRSAVSGAVIGAGFGAAFGGVGSALAGGSFWEGAGTGAAWGAGIGAFSGAIDGYLNAVGAEINPWTGVSTSRKVDPLTPAGYREMARREPEGLTEQMTLLEARSGAGGEIMKRKINNPRYKDRWQKRQHTHEVPNSTGAKPTNIDIHYWQHNRTGRTGGYKFKSNRYIDQGPGPAPGTIFRPNIKP